MSLNGYVSFSKGSWAIHSVNVVDGPNCNAHSMASMFIALCGTCVE